MRLRKARIDLNGVAVLNRGFAILTLLRVALPTFEVLLLANIGIARAAGQESSDDGKNKQQMKCGCTPHDLCLPTHAQSVRGILVLCKSLLHSDGKACEFEDRVRVSPHRRSIRPS